MIPIIYTPEEWKKIWLHSLKSNKIIGFVPTMGALHEGHLDLVRASIDTCDLTVVSIFVNPTQFNNQADFEKYPSTLSADLDKLKEEKVDYVFAPSKEVMYPQPTQINLDFGPLERILEGEFRPGHFKGVGLVVSKLFHMIQPHSAFFGQKDLQQVGIIRQLVKDLSFSITLRIIPTRREKDGLAMSSRNVRLTPEGRMVALLLYKSMKVAKSELLEGKNWFEVKENVRKKFDLEPLARLEYFELVHPEDMTIYSSFDANKKTSICVASYIGDVRLIDNLPINV